MLGLQKQHHSDLNAYKISLYLSLKAMESNVQEPYYDTKNVQFFQFRGDGLEWGWTHPILQPSSMPWGSISRVRGTRPRENPSMRVITRMEGFSRGRLAGTYY